MKKLFVALSVLTLIIGVAGGKSITGKSFFGLAKGVVIGTTGGKSATDNNFFGPVKGVVTDDDYESAGCVVGNAGYTVYIK